MNNELWDKVIEKHGHTCPGVALGFRIGSEVMRIFEDSEKVICKTAIHGCATDGVVFTLGFSGVNGELVFDANQEGYLFYAIDDEEGFLVTPKKLDVAPEADPALLILSMGRDKLFDIEPVEFEINA